MPDETLTGAHAYFTIPTREPSPELLSWADEIDKTPDSSEIDRFYSREAYRFAREGVTQVPVVVQVLRIGDIGIFTMPGEIYVEFARLLKAKSPSIHTMTANLANGCVGYVPIRELFQPGIYEARLASSSKLTPDAGYLMSERLLELAQTLWHA
jgi:hypothetical protein